MAEGVDGELVVIRNLRVVESTRDLGKTTRIFWKTVKVMNNINGVAIALKRTRKPPGESCRTWPMPKGVHETMSKQSGQKQQRTSLEDEQQIFHNKKRNHGARRVE